MIPLPKFFKGLQLNPSNLIRVEFIKLITSLYKFDRFKANLDTFFSKKGILFLKE